MNWLFIITMKKFLLFSFFTFISVNFFAQDHLILGGELGNSTASSAEDIHRIFPQLKATNLNTVLVPAYWDLIEETEGTFDFTLIDQTLAEAKTNDLNVIFLWFGAWKNSMSCYAPEWFKTDYSRFPRAQTETGKPLEIASAFSENVFKADSTAFVNFINHIKVTDTDHRVVMIQIENEIGMLESARDHSDIANKLFAENVPTNLMDYIVRNQDNLHSSLLDKWTKNGKKTEGSWQTIFGADIFTDEIFMAYYYALYVERLAKVARDNYDGYLYVNAAMNSRDRLPGQYPSAGPLAHLKDIWKCAAPTIDFLSPDIYDTGFASWASRYALVDNQLFIPEMRLCDGNGAQAFFAFGEYEALGVSPFSIESGLQSTNKLALCYEKLAELERLLLDNRGKGLTHGFLFDQENKEKVFREDGMTIKARHYFTLPWDPRATDGSTWSEAGGLMLKLGDGEYIIAGIGIVLEFLADGEIQLDANLGEDGFANAGVDKNTTNSWSADHRVGIVYCDEIKIEDDGTFTRLRRLNGDEDHQGRHVRIGVDEPKILYVKLYQYR